MTFKSVLVAIAAVGCVTAAHADIVTFVGDTGGGATFNRPLENFGSLSSVGTNVGYSAYSVSVDTSGDYTFLTTAEFDSFALLYGPTFDPTAPLTNGLFGNDDLISETTSGFEATLNAGTTYMFVATGFDNVDSGQFSTTIGGPGVITAVPEPETYALMALGLGVLGFARRYAQSRSA